MRKQYKSLDLFKFIFAILVVMIHTRPLMDISEAANWYFSNTVCMLAVPFFFMTSGFLLFDKLKSCNDKEKSNAVRKYVLHILRMYLVWCVIWIPWKALNYYNLGHFDMYDMLDYIRRIIFVSGGDALWYLPALAFSVVAVYILKKRLSNITIVLIAAAFYLFGVLIGTWYGAWENNSFVKAYYTVFLTTANGLLFGFLFTSMGMYVAEQKTPLREGNFKSSTLWFVFTFILLVIESIVIRKAGMSKSFNQCMLPVCVYTLFIMILCIECKGEFYTRLRNYSTLIYLSHCFIIRTIMLIAGIFDISLPYTVLFIITLALALLFSQMVYYLVTNKNVRALKILY